MRCETCGSYISTPEEARTCEECKTIEEKSPEMVAWVLRVIEHQIDKRERENREREAWHRSLDGS